MANRKSVAHLMRGKVISKEQQNQLEDYYNERGYSAQDVALAIVGAGLANAIALLAINGPFTFWNTIVGFIILCILLTYPPAPFTRFFLKVAYAAIFSISFLSAIGVLFNIAFAYFGGSFPNTNADCVIPFPSSSLYQRLCKPPSGSKPVTIFTPFNPYDLWFFGAWIVIFIICYWLFFVRGQRRSTEDAPPRHPLKSEQKHNSK